jgi:HK97 family phage portal protein
MGFFNRLLGRETRSARIKSSDPFLSEWFGQRDSASGAHVTPYLAENISVVAACVQIISETVAMLPCIVYRRMSDGGRIAEENHPVARILSGDATGTLTASEFIELMTAHCLLRGNSYAEIIRDGRGAVSQLRPHHPDSVSVVRLNSSGAVAFDVATVDAGPQRRILAQDMLHLKDRSDDGLIGRSRLSRAREAFAGALATEQYAHSTFANSAAMSGVLIHPGQLDEGASARLRQSLSAWKGASNAGRIGVLEEGMTWQPLSVSPDDAQMLESRRFGVENLARIFRVPPPMLGDYQGGNYSSIVEIHRIFYQHCLQPWLNRWERLLMKSLFSEEGRRTYEVEFDSDYLLRSDQLSRMHALKLGREIGLYNAQDLRRFERMPPRTDADAETYWNPMNMQPTQNGKLKED